VALGYVAVEKVLAAAIAGLADFARHLQDGYRGVFGSAFMQVIAVGVDERGTVLRRSTDPLRLVDSRVAFEGAQGEVQPPGALAETDARAE
jgi:hypothetical protein